MEQQAVITPAGQALLARLYQEREALRQDYRSLVQLAALPYRLHGGVSSVL
jgi:hypothetical protein